MLADGITNYVICSSCGKNYYTCDWCFCCWEPDVVRLILFIYLIVIHDVMRPICMWQVIGHKSLDVMRMFTWVWVLVTSPAPHPICVAVGICLYFYLGMGNWLWLELLLWLIQQWFGPLCTEYLSCQYTCHN